MEDKHVETNKEHMVNIDEEALLWLINELGGYIVHNDIQRDLIRCWLNAPYDAGDSMWYPDLGDVGYYKDPREARRNGIEVD